MRKLLPLLLLLAACEDEEPKPTLKPVSQPVAAAASAPAQREEAASRPVRELTAEGPRVITVENDCFVDGVAAYGGMPIKLTSVVETKADSRLVLTLGKGGIIQVRPNAKVELGKSERKEFSLKLLAGALWSFLPKGSSVEVVGQNVVAGVRGTTFYVQANGADDTYVCACDGEVDVTAGKKTKSLKSKKQHLGLVTKKGKQKPEKKAINHAKEEGALLEKLAKTIQ